MATVFEAAGHGDKLALGLLDHAIHYLGQAIANAVNLFNPEVVLLDASMAGAENLMVTPIRQIIHRQVISMAGHAPAVRVAKIGAEAAAWGAAMLMLDQLFDGHIKGAAPWAPLQANAALKPL